MQTRELIDEANMRYLKNRPGLVWDNVSYNLWPMYASSNVFFSSTMDYLMAQVKWKYQKIIVTL